MTNITKNNKYRNRIEKIDPSIKAMLSALLISTRRKVSFHIGSGNYIHFEKSPLFINRTINPELECGN